MVINTIAPAGPENRKLPKKEQDLFRSIVKFYETKQYKKGLKAADAILKKYPTHGETQAMKGLIYNCMEKKEEAYELVKLGLRNDVRSHVCWHVFGLLHRSDRNHKEATKCYLNALRIEKHHMQILKDLGNLQVQMRDLEGFVETKRTILIENKKLKVNWIGFAVANHLYGDLDQALKVIDAFLSTLDNREKGYEEGELVLYKTLILEQAGRVEEALAWLEAEMEYVVDGLSSRMKRAELLLALERFDDAHAAYRALLAENSEHYQYHCGLQSAVLRLDAATSADMLQMSGCALPSTELPSLSLQQRALLQAEYEELCEIDPSSLVCDKIPLTFLEGEAFKARVDTYMRKHLQRGLPSLGSDLAALYLTLDPETGKKVRAKDPYDINQNENFLVVKELVERYRDSLTKTEDFPHPPSSSSSSSTPTQNGTSSSSSSSFDAKNTLLWTNFLYVQLLEASGALPQALALLLDHCLPACASDDKGTSLDMHQRQARLLKKSGAIAEAASVMDQARKLDLADRYVNNKCTKYLLRAGRVEDAQAVIALFAKHEGDAQVYLCEMQCMWYELEWAKAVFAQALIGGGKEGLGRALKKFAAVEKHFADFVEDQFDFHNYCIRKMTLRAYVDVLRLEDGLLAHEYYLKAARGTVDCYLALLARPKEEEGGEVRDLYAGMTAAERKKEKAKARKAAKKQEEEAAAEKVAAAAAAGAGAGTAGAAAASEEEAKNKANKKTAEGVKIPVDDDPDGAKLAEKDPLEEAKRVMVSMTQHAAKVVETHTLAYDVATKRGKPLLALQALIRAHALRPFHPEVFCRTVDFVASLNEGGKEGGKEGGWAVGMHPTVAAVIEAEKGGLLGDEVDLGVYVEGYVETAKAWASLPHLLAAARGLARAQAQPGATEKAVALVKEGVREGKCRGLTVTGLKEALWIAETELQAGPAAMAEMRNLCLERFPSATYFASSS